MLLDTTMRHNHTPQANATKQDATPRDNATGPNKTKRDLATTRDPAVWNVTMRQDLMRLYLATILNMT